MNAKIAVRADLETERGHFLFALRAENQNRLIAPPAR